MKLSPVSGSTVAASLQRRHLMVAGALAAFVPAARSASSTLPQAVSLADELAAIRKAAQEGTDTDFGALDAPLLKVAAECALSIGTAAL